MAKPPKQKQPNLDTPLAIGLTPQEIYEVCDADTMSTAYERHPEVGEVIDDPEGAFLVMGKNKRTGYSALITTGVEEFEKSEYFVELLVEGVYVYLHWELPENRGDAEFALMRKKAHDAFIRVCTMIGINAGYQLAIEPTVF